MTQIAWDEVGERRFETGVDHGVLYPHDGLAVPWNGLVSVSENRSGEIKTYYQDGIPYLVHQVPGSYSAKLQAFTYPDELDALTGGSTQMSPGIMLHDQRAALPFDLSYRTLIGNDSDGMDHGYKIHLLYNVVAVPSDFSYGTTSKDLGVSPMEWELRGIPPTDWSLARPTAHISLDSREVDATLLTSLETMLYGADETDPTFPTQFMLNSMAAGGTGELV
jgi:hypothetical protein